MRFSVHFFTFISHLLQALIKEVPNFVYANRHSVIVSTIVIGKTPLYNHEAALLVHTT
jgi:hypothetical protein